jgi:hypothetical protein
VKEPFAVPSEGLGIDVVHRLLERFSTYMPKDSLALQVFQIDNATKARQLTEKGVKCMENRYSEDFALLKDFINGSRDAVLLRPNQNMGPDLLGLKTIMENEVPCKRTMWLSSKILQRVAQEESRCTRSQINWKQAYYGNRDTESPCINNHMKDVQKKFQEEIISQFDMDKVLMINVMLPKENAEYKSESSLLESGQVLINITLDNIQHLIEDTIIVSVIEEMSKADEISTQEIEDMVDPNDSDEEMTEPNTNSNHEAKIKKRKHSESSEDEKPPKKIRILSLKRKNFFIFNYFSVGTCRE